MHEEIWVLGHKKAMNRAANNLKSKEYINLFFQRNYCGASMGALRNFIDFVKEAFAITGVVLTSKWLWLIVGFAVYCLLQAWLMLAISPLAVLVLPGCLIIYLLWDEHRRIKPLLKKPQVDTTNWDVTTNVDNYIKTLTKAEILEEDRKKDYE